MQYPLTQRERMTYQLRAKLTISTYYGLTFEQVDLPYAEWAAIRSRYIEETGRDPNGSYAVTPTLATR